jgi:hypothetical protein
MVSFDKASVKRGKKVLQYQHLHQLSERLDEFEQAEKLKMKVRVFRERAQPLLAQVQEKNLEKNNKCKMRNFH